MTTKRDRIEGSLQENLLALLAFSVSSAPLIRNAVEVDLFATPVFRKIVSRIYDHIDRFKKPPREHLPDILEDLIKDEKEGKLVEDIVKTTARLGDSVNEEYILSQLNGFIRQQQLRAGITEASQALLSGDRERAEIALEKALRARLESFDKGIGLDDAVKALKEGRIQRDPLPTGIKPLDEAGLGPARKEIHIFIAPTGRGKSWWLIHMAKQAILNRLRVLYVTLELADYVVALRFLMSFFSAASRRRENLSVARLALSEEGKLRDITIEELKTVLNLTDPKDLKKIEKRLQFLHGKRNLIIKQFPTRSLTVKGFLAYLDSLERRDNFIPDLVCIDYANLFKVPIDEYRLSLGVLFQDLRGVAVERNLILMTASQANREGSQAAYTKAVHVSEDWSQIGTADGVIAYSQSPMERRLHLARLRVEKSRAEEDGLDVLIAQQYGIGQFCVQAVTMRESYNALIQASVEQQEQRRYGEHNVDAQQYED